MTIPEASCCEATYDKIHCGIAGDDFSKEEGQDIRGEKRNGGQALVIIEICICTYSSQEALRG